MIKRNLWIKFAAIASFSAVTLAFAQQKEAETRSTRVEQTEQDLLPPTKIEKSDTDWKNSLAPAQYAVLREKGTERVGSSPLLKEHRTGVFRCAACDLPLFASDAKFESGTGWPSFWKSFVVTNVLTATDASQGWNATKFFALDVAGILDMFSTTDPSRPAFAIV